MTDLATLDAFGVLTEPATLTIRRHLPGPIERVWAYLTESDRRRKWLAAGEMELRVGAPFEFVWRNGELNDPPAARPEGFSEEHRMASRITELDPPNRISFTWAGSGDVTFALEEQGDGVLLTVIHRRIDDPGMRLNVSAGWHAHLDVLAARAAGREPPVFWSHWMGLKEEYKQRLGL
ncbi:SRPBCC family protein [Phreatobacter sp.]|uniref:SRPBCC family protein n=1 Tax=Phreatobacter sp. TaxID=1966341 RepID=UPI003F72F22F